MRYHGKYGGRANPNDNPRNVAGYSWVLCRSISVWFAQAANCLRERGNPEERSTQAFHLFLRIVARQGGHC
jgi:hypothetical protein